MLPTAVLILLLVALLTWSGAVRAGASLDVDDATITPEGRCQAESWVRRESALRQWVTVPACTVGGTEISLDLSGSDPGAGGIGTALGLKRVLRELDGHDWGMAVSLSAGHVPGLGPEWALVVPVSVALDSAQNTLIHLNVGVDARAQAATTGSAGVGLERVLNPHWTLLAEALADNHGGHGGQIGLRRALRANATFDMLAGNHRGQGDTSHWLTLGLNVLLPQ